MTLLLTAVLCSAAAAAPSGDGQIRRMYEALDRNMNVGDWDMCRSLLAELMRILPGDPRLPYNLACVDALAGDAAGAMADLHAAVDLGWTDVRTMEADPDLTPLRSTEPYKTLVADMVDDLLANAGAQIFRLEDGALQSLGLLEDMTSDRVIRLEMGFDDDGFRIRATGPAAVIRPPADHNRGGELLLTLTAPDSLRSFDTRRAWRFAFGSRDGAPQGRLLGLPGRPLHQPVADLAPVFTNGPAPDELVLETRVPWSYLAPYAPPADALFGVNVGHTGPGRFNQLISDPAMVEPGALWHRFRPVRLALDAESTPRLTARLSNALVGATPVEIELIAWCGAAGDYTLSTDVLDADHGSVVVQGGETETVSLQAGRNILVRSADLSALPEGPYELSAALTPATGEPLSWHARVLRLRSDWLNHAHDRSKPVSVLEQPSLLWRLDLVFQEMTRRDARSFPAALATTVSDVETMLARQDEAGTILPEAGAVVMLCPAEGDRTVRQTLYLSAGWKEAATAAVLVLLDAGGLEAPDLGLRLGDRIAAVPGTIVAVPQLPARTAGTWGDGTREAAAAAISWLDARFPGRPFRLAVLNDGGDAADLANLRPGTPTDLRWIGSGDDALETCLDWMSIR